MPRRAATLLGASTLLFGWAPMVFAQSFDSRPRLLVEEAASLGGLVRGVVRDDAGRAIGDASVVALGGAPLPVVAKSDATGQFTLALAPGEYVLRATRVGYVSTYREAVKIQRRTEIERTIVLLRREPGSRGRVLLASSGAEPADAPAPEDEPGQIDSSGDGSASDPGHGEAAWRLRHLTPTALRDVADAALPREGLADAYHPHPSFVDWVMGESARAAASFFTNTSFTGQVNFLTTSTLGSAGSWLPAELPHGIAYISVGAPVGSSGDWTVRGAMSASALASWVVLGEYSARSDQPHAFRAGVSYSSQPTTAGNLTASTLNEPVRSVGGIYAYDRWHIDPAVELDYGLRLDRYDYVSDAEFLSPQLGVRLALLPGTHLTLAGADHSLAPGADEFLPPVSATGLWLPPERTFSPLLSGASFRAERVRDLQVGVEQRLTESADGPVVAVRRFRQSARDQIATIFGLDTQSAGNYYVATPGSVSAVGWIVRVSGPLVPHLNGSVQYTTSDADWTADFEAGEIVAMAPELVRPGRERLHDVVTSMSTLIPETSTKLAVAYRITAATAGRAAVPLPSNAGRFNVEVRQALPLRLTRTSRTDLVVVVRNLFRDPADPGSLYDEVLTVAPPLRVMGGVQVRF